MDDLITFCKTNTTGADSEKGTSAVNCYLVLWANRQTGDNYADASSSSAKITTSTCPSASFSARTPPMPGTMPKDDDNDYKRLQLVPNSEALTENGYDSSKADAAYKAAKYYVNILNAKSYHTILGERAASTSSFPMQRYRSLGRKFDQSWRLASFARLQLHDDRLPRLSSPSPRCSSPFIIGSGRWRSFRTWPSALLAPCSYGLFLDPVRHRRLDGPLPRRLGHGLRRGLLFRQSQRRTLFRTKPEESPPRSDQESFMADDRFRHRSRL
jgi:hypothetical protein